MKLLLFIAVALTVFAGACGLVPSTEPEGYQSGPDRSYKDISVQDAQKITTDCLLKKKVQPEDIHPQKNEYGAWTYVTSADKTRDMQISFLPLYHAIYEPPVTRVKVMSPVMSGMLPSKYGYQEFYTCFETGFLNWKLNAAATKSK